MAIAQGTWVQSGNPMNVLNPFNYDTGLTEGLASIFGGNVSKPSGYNNPAVWQQAANPNPQNQTYIQAGTQSKINPVNTQQINGQNVPNNATTGGTGGLFNPNPNPNPNPGPSPEEVARGQYEDRMRGSINAGWDSYEGQLNNMLNVGLPGQRSAQEQIAQESYNQGVNQLGSQKQSSLQSVERQQASSLKDLADNVKNLFTAGSISLGARGAADSSAANQYSYAITQMGNKNRGNILSQANDRINQISDIYNTEVNRLESEKNTNMAKIAQWFNEAQNAVRSQIGQAGLGRQRDIQSLSTNIYNQALQAMQSLQQETAQRRATLESWAASNSKTAQELVQNMQAVQQMPGFQGISNGMPMVDSSGNMSLPATGYGATATQKKDIFGNVIA